MVRIVPLLLAAACAPGERDAAAVYVAGETHTIAWEAPEATADLELVSPTGAATPLAQGVTASGKLDWTVPLEVEAGRGYSLRFADRDGTPVQQAVTLGALIGFRWNGAQEELLRLDPVTGNTLLLGLVGDLERWNVEVALDRTAALTHIWGVDAAGQEKIYTMDMFSGAFLGDVAVHGTSEGWQVNSQGDLLGLRWNGAVEELVSLDPATGLSTPIGVVGDLAVWSAETAIDATTDTLYVVGADASDAWSLYVMDALSGALVDKLPLAEPVGGLQWSPSTQQLYACRWDGAAEQLVTLDPATGATAAIGLVGGLQSSSAQTGYLQTWSAQTVLDDVNATLYVFGHDGVTDKLYAMDLTTGALRYETALSQPLLAPRLVY
ncbi:MAG: hypothetical protein H6739_09605 [Alphaproteobacteria bacterium]|nr:hypothetical protein [Alphaproteobacteria bacterium]